MYPEIKIEFDELYIGVNGRIAPIAMSGSFVYDYSAGEIIEINLDVFDPTGSGRASEELHTDHPQYSTIKNIIESNPDLIAESRPSDDEIEADAAAYCADLKRDEVMA
jgi:hypothetical protein